MARPQFTTQESNNSLLLSTTKERVTDLKVIPGLIMDFGRKFPNARQPALCHERRIYKKVME